MAQANDANADDRTRAALLRLLDFEAGDHETSHEIYADDAVLEFPQSGERFVGKRNFLEWRQQCNTGRGGSAAAATSGSSRVRSATTAANGSTASASTSSATTS